MLAIYRKLKEEVQLVPIFTRANDVCILDALDDAFSVFVHIGQKTALVSYGTFQKNGAQMYQTLCTQETKTVKK